MAQEDWLSNQTPQLQPFEGEGAAAGLKEKTFSELEARRLINMGLDPTMQHFPSNDSIDLMLDEFDNEYQKTISYNVKNA